MSNLLLGLGRGNEIMQGRLGPGRIHHAMRSIGSAEVALEWMIARLNDERKVPFGKPLREHGVLIEWVAKSRIEIDSGRLVVLNAAIKIDQGDAKAALTEIAQAKVLVPTMACNVIDRAVQTHGAMGVCQDTPLASMWAHIRTIRIADGPDEVHLNQMGRRENRARAAECTDRIARQKKATAEMMKKSVSYNNAKFYSLTDWVYLGMALWRSNSGAAKLAALARKPGCEQCSDGIWQFVVISDSVCS